LNKATIKPRYIREQPTKTTMTHNYSMYRVSLTTAYKTLINEMFKNSRDINS